MRSILRWLTDDNKDWFLSFRNDWDFHPCNNWYDFTFIQLDFEWDKIMGGLEAHIAFMGLHLRWRWNYKMTDERQGLVDAVKDIKAGTATLLPFRLGEFTGENDGMAEAPGWDDVEAEQ